MVDGGFVIKFDGKEVGRGYAVSFNYDEWTYTVNDESLDLPEEVEKIEILVDKG